MGFSEHYNECDSEQNFWTFQRLEITVSVRRVGPCGDPETHQTSPISTEHALVPCFRDRSAWRYGCIKITHTAFVWRHFSLLHLTFRLYKTLGTIHKKRKTRRLYLNIQTNFSNAEAIQLHTCEHVQKRPICIATQNLCGSYNQSQTTTRYLLPLWFAKIANYCCSIFLRGHTWIATVAGMHGLQIWQ